MSKKTCGITRLRIDSTEVAFDGRTFGKVGCYVKLRGTASGALDPDDPRNAMITDLALAPRNADGLVEYSTDFYILRPADPAAGNGRLVFEVTNRGRKLFGAFNGSANLTNDPKTAADAGSGFLMHAGYSLAWAGWDPTVPAGDDALRLGVPVARGKDGSRITGPSYEYLVFDAPGVTQATLAYAAAEGNHPAVLTVRDHLTDPPVVIERSDWEYAGPKSIRLLPTGSSFKQGAIYEFVHTVVDPSVCGIGFAATRDFLSFLRDPSGKGSAGIPRHDDLLGHAVTRVLGLAISQAARFINDFVWLGFNQDLEGGRVFDGVLTWMGAGTGAGLNVRFAQPGRTERIRQHHLYPEATFPFAWHTLTDPVTGRSDGRAQRALESGTMPRLMVVNSSNEYWSKTASLAHTDLDGKDLPDPDSVRFYLLASTEHTIAGSAPDLCGPCRHARNTIDPNPALRALFVALEEWLDGIIPPPSAVPRTAEGTAAFIEPCADSYHGIGVVPAAALGWPALPEVLYTGVATIRNRFDFGSEAASGVLSKLPPARTGVFHRSFVPVVDADGHDVAGIRLPPVAAPLATYTGWGVRADDCGGPDGCEQFGQRIPLLPNLGQRQARLDPRPSLEERYGSKAGYVAAVAGAAHDLVRRRLLLEADARAYIAEAEGVEIDEASDARPHRVHR